MKQKKVQSRFQKANAIILLLHLLFPVWLFAFMYTSAISGMLFFIWLIACLLLGVIYKLVQKYQRGKRVLYAARGIAICTIVAYYLPMLLLMGFSNTKLLYTVKRADYTYGVYGPNAPYYARLLPAKLPEQCEDYSFRTQGSMVAQDYHPSSFLMFRTDCETLDAYAAYYDTLDCERRENDPDNAELQQEVEWFCGQMRLRQSLPDNLEHAVLYWFDDRYPQVVLLNYETGLVAILT